MTEIEEKITKLDGTESTRKYRMGKALGKGGFATCCEFTNLSTSRMTACKIVPKSKLENETIRSQFVSEVQIHRLVHHKHIVEFEHFFEDSENLYFLLEMCSNATMKALIKRRKQLTEEEVRYYSWQLISALKYLHSLNILHRDLKLDNLLLDHNMLLKVSDFGLAVKLENPFERRNTVCGTPNFLAPEIIKNRNGHSFEVDIWSVGVIMYTMLVGKPPFDAPNVETIYKRIKSADFDFPSGIEISAPAKNLIQRIIVRDPALRLTLDEITAHEFFQAFDIPKTMPSHALHYPPNSLNSRSFLPRLQLTQSSEALHAKALRYSKHRCLITTQERPEVSPIHGYTLLYKWRFSKHGFAFALNNAACGVIFKDEDIVVLSPAGKFVFKLEAPGYSVNQYPVREIPKQLKRKVEIVFKNREKLQGRRQSFDDWEDLKLTFVKKYYGTEYAMIVRLSSNIVQAFFRDSSELVFFIDTHSIAYTNQVGKTIALPVRAVIHSTNEELLTRLKYVKDALAEIMCK